MTMCQPRVIYGGTDPRKAEMLRRSIHMDAVKVNSMPNRLVITKVRELLDAS